jgi:hypothetical protein
LNLIFILQLLEPLFRQPDCSLSCCWTAVSVATGATFQLLGPFQLHRLLSEPLSESPSTIAAVTKVKILSIDLEASSFDGITNSTSRGSELVSTIAKLECLILSFFYAMCSALISTTNNAAGNLDISEIEPKFSLI